MRPPRAALIDGHASALLCAPAARATRAPNARSGAAIATRRDAPNGQRATVRYPRGIKQARPIRVTPDESRDRAAATGARACSRETAGDIGLGAGTFARVGSRSGFLPFRVCTAQNDSTEYRR